MKDEGALEPQAVIGPNAILNCAPALRAVGGDELARRLYAEAGVLDMLDHPPQRMVPQTEVAALHRTIATALPPETAERVAWDAGARTGRYILENRIPMVARAALRTMPRRLSAPALLRAIESHAWTFAGDADVFQEVGPPMRLAILDNPLAVGPCTWHRAVLQTIFRGLISPEAVVHESRCCSSGSGACVFEISL